VFLGGGGGGLFFFGWGVGVGGFFVCLTAHTGVYPGCVVGCLPTKGFVFFFFFLGGGGGGVPKGFVGGPTKRGAGLWGGFLGGGENIFLFCQTLPPNWVFGLGVLWPFPTPPPPPRGVFWGGGGGGLVLGSHRARQIGGEQFVGGGVVVPKKGTGGGGGGVCFFSPPPIFFFPFTQLWPPQKGWVGVFGCVFFLGKGGGVFWFPCGSFFFFFGYFPHGDTPPNGPAPIPRFFFF